MLFHYLCIYCIRIILLFNTCILLMNGQSANLPNLNLDVFLTCQRKPFAMVFGVLVRLFDATMGVETSEQQISTLRVVLSVEHTRRCCQVCGLVCSCFFFHFGVNIVFLFVVLLWSQRHHAPPANRVVLVKKQSLPSLLRMCVRLIACLPPLATTSGLSFSIVCFLSVGFY